MHVYLIVLFFKQGNTRHWAGMSPHPEKLHETKTLIVTWISLNLGRIKMCFQILFQFRFLSSELPEFSNIGPSGRPRLPAPLFLAASWNQKFPPNILLSTTDPARPKTLEERDLEQTHFSGFGTIYFWGVGVTPKIFNKVKSYGRSYKDRQKRVSTSRFLGNHNPWKCFYIFTSWRITYLFFS